MSAEARIAAALALSLGAGLVATPVAIRAAVRIGFYDRPVGYKGHAAPTPYLGGAAVVAGFLVGALAIAFFLKYLQRHTLRAFIYYRLVFGIIVIALAFFRRPPG